MTFLAATTLPVPRAVRVIPLLGVGTDLPGGHTVAGGEREPALSGGVQCVQAAHGQDPVPRAFVHLRDESGAWGVYRFTIDPRAGRLAETVKVVRAGDVLAGGATVQAVGHGDASLGAGWSGAVRLSDDRMHVATWTPGGGARLLPLDGVSDPSPLVSSNEEGHLVLVGRMAGLQRLLLVRGAEIWALLSVGDLLVDTRAVVTSLGISHTSGDVFVVQGEARNARGEALERADAAFAVRGVVGERPSLIAAPEAFDVTPSRAREADFHLGAARTAPRVGPDGRVGMLVHTSRTEATLCVDELRVTSVGELSPRGRPIVAFMPPVMGHGGLFSYVAVTAEGMELVMSNGLEQRTVLATGDAVGDGHARMLVGGVTPRQMLGDGSVLLVVEDTAGAPWLVMVQPA